MEISLRSSGGMTLIGGLDLLNFIGRDEKYLHGI